MGVLSCLFGCVCLFALDRLRSCFLLLFYVRFRWRFGFAFSCAVRIELAFCILFKILSFCCTSDGFVLCCLHVCVCCRVIVYVYHRFLNCGVIEALYDCVRGFCFFVVALCVL